MLALDLTLPDDWHLHIRDGEILRTVLPHTSHQFGRAIIMPNLQPPITHLAQALAYRQQILQALPAEQDFQPLMTLYLTEHTTPEQIMEVANSEHVVAAKLYPAGATTHSDAGVRDVEAIYPVLAAMERHALPLLVHGEVTDPAVDIFDREAVFAEKILGPLLACFDQLPVIFEHITTKQAVEYVESGPPTLGATITAHHLLLNRNNLLVGGIQPHHYCLPILKRESHRQALLGAATSGNPKFFLGTDSAPHLVGTKESAYGCAGCYTAHAALPLYAQAFAEVDALDRLENFAAHFGADFYGLPRNTKKIRLVQQEWCVPEVYKVGQEHLIPLFAGKTLAWKVAEGNS